MQPSQSLYNLLPINKFKQTMFMMTSFCLYIFYMLYIILIRNCKCSSNYLTEHYFDFQMDPFFILLYLSPFPNQHLSCYAIHCHHKSSHDSPKYLTTFFLFCQILKWWKASIYIIFKKCWMACTCFQNVDVFLFSGQWTLKCFSHFDKNNRLVSCSNNHFFDI
jgi:hypothetical protein